MSRIQSWRAADRLLHSKELLVVVVLDLVVATVRAVLYRKGRETIVYFVD